MSTIGTLYIVATPIGNLEDITLRALRVLKEVDLIAAEDTRHTKKLLSHFGIKTPLISYHAHNQASRGPGLIERLKNGETVALVSDAGTPGFSDPGADLVARAWEAGVRVEAIPGPAAGVAALSLSGFKGDILFVGFLPRGEGRRLKLLQALAAEYRVIILYEAPKRLARTLTEIAGSMPRREVLVVRELTKKFEQTWRYLHAPILLGPRKKGSRKCGRTGRTSLKPGRLPCGFTSHPCWAAPGYRLPAWSGEWKLPPRIYSR